VKTSSEKRPKVEILSLQWHLTDRCNWRCRHCYAEGYEGEEMSLPELKRVFLEYIDLLKKTGKKGRLNLTGGEPFIREDFLEFLEFISESREYLTRCSILTNGSLLTPAILKRIKEKTCVTGIQISIEGPEEINDAIRGKGSFEKILAAVSLVKESGIPTHLAATISRFNHKRIFELLDLLLIYDIPIILRRFVPMGSGKKEKESLLSPTELREVYLKASKLSQKYKLKFSKRMIFMTNICSSGLKYIEWTKGDFRICGIKRKEALTIMPNGDVYPCRLLPIKLGNTKENSLEEIYNQPYEDFVAKNKYDAVCNKCNLKNKCGGGAACIAYAIAGNPFARDPQCWKK
jgi:radical SAM protein with 4Fe4S-binding SPASM domain